MYKSELYDALIPIIKERVPEFEIRYKNKSTLMKFLNFFVRPFNDHFMTRTTTTVGDKIYYPDKEYEDYRKQYDLIITLAHEYVHILRCKKNKAKFFLNYFFPQILAVGALFSFLTFVNLWFLLCLLFLVFLTPIPSPGRTAIEYEGYLMTSLLEKKFYGHFLQYMDQDLEKIFSGSVYYFMATKDEAKKIGPIMKAQINNNKLPKDNEAFNDVLDLINAK